MKCKAPLLDYLSVGRNPLHPSLEKIEEVCEKLDSFKKCVKDVDQMCLKSMPNLQIKLYEYLCQFPIKDSIKVQEDCFAVAKKENYIKDCLDNITITESNNVKSSILRNEIILANTTETKRSTMCHILKGYSKCYSQAAYLKVCQKAASVEHDILKYIAESVNVEDCGLSPFSAIVSKYEELENEKNCGTCDDKGACNCTTGFQPDADKKYCVDINECLGENQCEQTCINSKGSFTCDCYAGIFVLNEDGKSCDIVDKDVQSWLFFAHGQSIWKISEDGKDFELQKTGLEKAAMIDIDIKEKKLYYSDISLDVIERIKIDGAISEPIQNYEVDGVEGIAVDWVGRNLYSVRRNDIFVQTLEGKFRKALYKNVLKMPRALVCHPLKSKLFISDWSSHAFIASANMDGSEFKRIITDGIVWPNGLTVDVYTNKIYWGDAFLDSIQSADLDGQNRNFIIQNPAQVPHIFGMTVSNSYLYWTDWTTKGIVRANKKTGANLEILAQTALLPYSIKLYHPSAQPQIKNPCEGLKCSQLCLLKNNATEGVCGCSDGFTLAEDGITCQSSCTANEHLCEGSNPRCLSKRYLCDGVIHCQDQSDEGTTLCPPRICIAGQFQCHDNKKCLPAAQLCDKTAQCADSSDEQYC
uniref:EGF-like domain-containing protein n=1 Tax=Rhabditophanes sp. KR3021 TaxID=114890 RepID=A0AC35TMH7_9BILA